MGERSKRTECNLQEEDVLSRFILKSLSNSPSCLACLFTAPTEAFSPQRPDRVPGVCFDPHSILSTYCDLQTSALGAEVKGIPKGGKRSLRVSVCKKEPS